MFFPLFIGGFPSHVGFFCAQIPVEDELFLRRMIAHVDLKLGDGWAIPRNRSWWSVDENIWEIRWKYGKFIGTYGEHIWKYKKYRKKLGKIWEKITRTSGKIMGKSWEQSYFPASHVLHLDLLSLWFVSCPVVNPQEVGIFLGEGRWGHQANLCLDLWPKSNLVIRTTGDDSEPI